MSGRCFFMAMLLCLALQVTALFAQHSALCSVTVDDGGGMFTRGSGILIAIDEEDSRLGYVLTNAHVVRDRVKQDRQRCKWQNHESYGLLLGVDKKWDLALLKVWRPGGVKPPPIRIDRPKIGESLIVQGTGRGVIRSTEGQLSRWVTRAGGTVNDWMEIGHTQARGGDSGGPVFDKAGSVVGILWGGAKGSTYASCGSRLRSFIRTCPPCRPHYVRPVAPPPEKQTVSSPGCCSEPKRLIQVESTLEEISKRLDDLQNIVNELPGKCPCPARSGPPPVDVDQMVLESLKDCAIKVVFESGDDKTEPERVVMVGIINGELRIPPQVTRIRAIVDNVESVQTDTAPLGLPIRVKIETTDVALAQGVVE